MKMLKVGIVAATTISMGLGTAVAFADGAQLYTSKLCVTCHGAEGKAPLIPAYPKLAGIEAARCNEQAMAIRDGKRTTGLSVAMKGTVAAVTDAEFTEICSYLAGIK